MSSGNYSFGIVIINPPTVPNPNQFSLTSRPFRAGVFAISDVYKASGYELTPMPDGPGGGSAGGSLVLIVGLALAVVAVGGGMYVVARKRRVLPS